MSGLKDKKEQYNNLLNYKELDEENENKLVITLRAIFVTFFVVAITALSMFIITNFDDISTIIENFTDRKLAGSNTINKGDLTPSKFNFKMLSRYQNILLLGVDSNGPNTLPFSGVRSDTIVILNVDLHGKSINAISIPRDSKVYLAEGHGVQKINAAYALGGIDLTKKTIEETLGIKIHNYVVVNSEGVRKLIDTIGGVPIYIDQNMHYNDNTANLHINFNKGNYVLDGEKAEEYLRFRKDYLGDIGRVHRQQKFIKALFEQIKTPEALKKIPDALKIASLYTRTDLNLYQMSQYAAAARDIDLNKVEFVMLPGNPNKKGIISYWILDPEKTQEVINRLIYRQKTELENNEFSIGIMFPNQKEIDAMYIKEQLKSAGYDVNCTGRTSQIEVSQIIGYNAQISNDMIKTMQRKVPEISHLKYVHNPVRNYCNTSDVVITLDND
jgi:LCP family protein required for cell wall assembly